MTHYTRKRRTRIADNSPQVRIEIEWNYTPPGYFEEKITWERKKCLIEIEGGHITARMGADFFDSQAGLRDSLTQELHYYFLGAQLIRRQPFNIHGGAIYRVWPDGRRDTTLVVDSVKLVMTGENVDLIFKDDKGIVHDTRRDRIEATKNLAGLSVRHCITDPKVRKILDSFDDAVRDPENEFVYLFEIWEALRERLQGTNAALDVLKISNEDLTRFYNLTCNLPLKQGRHRGLFENLRDATIDELDGARRIAQTMVERYLNYLDEQQNPSSSAGSI